MIRPIPILFTTAVLSASSLPAATPDDSVERGIALYRDGNYGDAARVLERAAEETSGSLEAWTYLGLSRLELDQHDGAAAAFQKALALDEDSAPAHYGLGLAEAHRDRVDAAIEHLQRTVEIDPAHAYAHYHLGLAYNQKDRTDRTLLHLQRFLELEPDAPEAPRVRALLSRLR